MKFRYHYILFSVFVYSCCRIENDLDIIAAISAIGLTLYEKGIVNQNDIGLALVEAKKHLEN